MIAILLLMFIIWVIDDGTDYISPALDDEERTNGKYAAYVAALEMLGW